MAAYLLAPPAIALCIIFISCVSSILSSRFVESEVKQSYADLHLLYLEIHVYAEYLLVLRHC